MRKNIYLDHAASTPMAKSVLAAMTPYFIDNFYNPSATYLSAKAVQKDVDKARTDIAFWLGSRSTEVIFTAGGTESNNLAIRGIMDLHQGANLVVSSMEHESVLKPSRLYNYKLSPVNNDGLIDIIKLEQLIDDKTVLVSVMYVNNEIGSIQPLKQISKLLNKIRGNRKLAKNPLPIYLHTDACQAPTYLDLHVNNLGADLMTLNSGKIYGPKQFGALYVNHHINISPQILGGGQEMGLRSGTENPASIVGFAKALSLAQYNKTKESQRLKQIQLYFINQLINKIPNLKINGTLDHRIPNNINISIPGQDNESMIMKLDELGIQCASGSACGANKQDLSTSLLSIGLTKNDVRSSLRFSMGQTTSKKDIEYVTYSITRILR